MIQTPPAYGAFNARWLKAEDVARSFVPLPQFRQLSHSQHSVILGPRGCGKTTLLKMLTRQALTVWRDSDRSKRLCDSFAYPAYEAVYIPADVRWCYELASVGKEDGLDGVLAVKAQRLMVAANNLVNLLATVELLAEGDRKIEVEISERIIRRWSLERTLRSISDVRGSLFGIASSVRGFLAQGDIGGLQGYMDQIDPSIFGHALDAPIETVQLVNDCLSDKQRPEQWAFCFDELEIAPAWLRKELLESLRSVNQNILLKLTWSPLLPSGFRTAPESAGDFKAIRLWHSHLADPRAFCEDLTREFLIERLAVASVEPMGFFRRSVLAAEPNEEPLDAYEKGSTEYEVFKDLAQWDESFSRLMLDHGLDPQDPVPKNPTEKDTFFRKVKPIAMLRKEFLFPDLAGRSRKAVTVYAGLEAIYAMSEGNPRWLLGLLNDFIDIGKIKTEASKEVWLNYREQARILNHASRRLQAQIKASPFRYTHAFAGDKNYTLFDFVEKVGQFFKGDVLGKQFPLDPVSSFFVPPGTDPNVVALVEQLLEIGAVVYVGKSPQDVPVQVVGSRFRLSYMLAPVFRLPLRLYRSISLNDILSGKYDESQSQFDFLQ